MKTVEKIKRGNWIVEIETQKSIIGTVLEKIIQA